jgi:signal peptidase I
MFSKNFSRNKKMEQSPETPANPLLPEASVFFEEILNKGLSLRLRATGRSMAPFLRGGEIITIKKVPSASLRIGDLIFFKNRESSLLLHRIVKKQRTGSGLVFQTKGDAVTGIDNPVHENNILGKACTIEKIASCIPMKPVDMESSRQRGINYVRAKIGLGTSVLSSAVPRKMIPSFFRSAFKKVFL